ACAIVGIFALGNVHSALAALDTGIAFGAGTGLSATDPRIIIANIIRVLLGFLGTIAVVLIMYAGFVMMTSEGDPAKTQKAKDVLKSAIIGLIIILSAFGIASFVINSLMEATTGIKQAPQESGAPTGFNGGMSALGGGIIQSVYPYPFQKDVPRNTSIMITFKEPMASSTLMDTAGNMLVANVSIFMKGDTCTEKGCTIPRKGLLVTAKARTVDNKTFVFTPNALIGLVSNNSDYMVSLGDGIAKANGEKAFTNMNASGRSWEFQANTTTDLDPPRVSSIFPRPDNSKDINLGAGLAAQATGQIIASSTPNIDVVASANPLASNAVKVNVIGNYNCSKDQIISVSLDDAMIATVNASSGGGAFGLVNGDNAADGKIEIGCGLTVSKADSLPFTAGDIWQIVLISSKSADTLTVGSITYKFVSALVSGVSN
ncbi:MAG: Ig-like domain-containing protein, partial [Candidatus Falkowbacteria bacterium]|nr:Ig-like domain-containing protein [Candidatus Falkowbacteria bacterium]